MVDYERRINPIIGDRELHTRIASSPEVLKDRREFMAEMALARRRAINKRDNALEALNALSAEIRNAHPELSEAEAFAKAYAANPELAARERQASRAALYA